METLAQTFTVTDAAAKRIAAILKNEPEGSRFRISVQGGGCSGFQYKLDFDTRPPGATDMIIEKDGATIVIDDLSLDFIRNSTLNYIEALGYSEFEITNPNATAKCGCGNSFAV